jgi:hypothetical protein
MVMPNSFSHLEKIRELEQKGLYAEADEWLQQNLQSGKRPDSYQLAGWLNIEYLNAGSLKETYRELDLKTGITKNIYHLEDGSSITQRVFAAGAADVIGVMIESDALLNFKKKGSA